MIFTSGSADALSGAIRGLIPEGSRVLIGPYEHNLIYGPVLERHPRILHTVRGGGGFGWDMEDFREKCESGVDFAVISHVSNVTGCSAPLKDISEAVHRSGGVLIVDASLSAGVLPVSMQADGIDILCTAGHRGLLGPVGTGLLLAEPSAYLRERAGIRPICRGSKGTVNLPGIAGLDEGISFLKQYGIRKLAGRRRALADYCMGELRRIPDVTVYGRSPADTGLFSFRIAGETPEMTGMLLNESYYVGVCAGLHDAPLAHRTLGTMPDGTVRVSFGCFNEKEEADDMIQAVAELARH